MTPGNGPNIILDTERRHVSARHGGNRFVAALRAGGIAILINTVALKAADWVPIAAADSCD
ncbi:MAG: hypothetical protein ABI885_01425 [Gammaproteobacteria bacterium]